MAMTPDMRNTVLARCWAAAVRKSDDESLPLTQQWRPNFCSVVAGMKADHPGEKLPSRRSIQRAWDAQSAQECAQFCQIHAEVVETRGKAAAQEMAAQWRGMMGVYLTRLHKKASSQKEWDKLSLGEATRATVDLARLGNFLLPLAPDLVGVTDEGGGEEPPENVVQIQKRLEEREQKLRELG